MKAFGLFIEKKQKKDLFEQPSNQKPKSKQNVIFRASPILNISILFFSNEKKFGFHMRYQIFLHYGWFPQNLGKDCIQTNMHTTVVTLILILIVHLI